MATCKHCVRVTLARGLCGLHYQRWKKFGDALHSRPSEMDRFVRLFKVTPTDCWIWHGTKLPQGYGMFRTGSRLDGTRRYERAPRSAWRLYRGVIPDGMIICHRCDVPACVNPDHLFLGTNKDNTRDMIEKGRHKPATHWPQMKRRDDGSWMPLKD